MSRVGGITNETSEKVKGFVFRLLNCIPGVVCLRLDGNVLAQIRLKIEHVLKIITNFHGH